MITVEQLYQYCDVLDAAKDKIGDHEKEYLAILEAVESDTMAKKLAAQLIARFLKDFPNVAEQAINAILDLCEDDDVEIRKYAIRSLPTLCKDNNSYVPRIADALTQLFQTDEPTELQLVQTSLLSVSRLDLKGALDGLFSQIMSGDDVIRDGAIKFLSKKIFTLPEEMFTKEIEEHILEESKKVLEDVTGDEFVTFMKVLSHLKVCSTVQGRQQLVDIIAEQLDLDQEFQPDDSDYVDRLIQCGKQALMFFSKNVHSTKYVAYIIDQVLPHVFEITNQNEGEDVTLEVLRLFAEMSSYATDLENLPERVKIIFTQLLKCMPLPPAGENGDAETSPEGPKLQFSYVECLMFAFHQIGRKYSEFFTGVKNADKLKDFRKRLQYFAQGSQAYCKQIKMALDGKTGEALKTDENKIKVAALKVTSNITALIRDLFHNPPAYKAMITLSWKPMIKTNVPAPITQKRSSSTEGGPGGKKIAKQDRQLYAPPSGKFSDKAGTFPGNRGRGGFRGRNRGRGRGYNAVQF